MREMGTFQQTSQGVIRTIYLSPAGNLLAEVGRERGRGGRPFFALKTVVNSGKFLETHSLAKAKQEKSDPANRHQRRSADHKDILRAFEEHDRFVNEFTYGSYREAQYDAEKFARFLQWGGESNAI